MKSVVSEKEVTRVSRLKLRLHRHEIGGLHEKGYAR